MRETPIFIGKCQNLRGIYKHIPYFERQTLGEKTTLRGKAKFSREYCKLMGKC